MVPSSMDTKIIPEMKELIETYEPEVLWSDGNWEVTDTYWKATEFLAWLYNESPVKDVVVANDRWGSNTQCTHGDIYTCNDKYNPGLILLIVKLFQCCDLPHNLYRCVTAS